MKYFHLQYLRTMLFSYRLMQLNEQLRMSLLIKAVHLYFATSPFNLKYAKPLIVISTDLLFLFSPFLIFLSLKSLFIVYPIPIFVFHILPFVSTIFLTPILLVQPFSPLPVFIFLTLLQPFIRARSPFICNRHMLS